MIFEQRCHLAPGQPRCRLNGRHFVSTDGLQNAISPYPDRAVSGSKARIHAVVAKSLPGRITDDTNIAKAIQSLGCRDPHISFPVLVKLIHGIAGQTVRSQDGIYFLAMYAEDAAAVGSNPQSILAV